MAAPAPPMTQTYCEQPSIMKTAMVPKHANMPTVSVLKSEEGSFIAPNAVDQSFDCKSNKSGLTVNTGRRSRKERSGFRSGAKKSSMGATGSTLKKFPTTTNVTQVVAEQEPVVEKPKARIMPGSDTISLELDIKGMVSSTSSNQLETQESQQEVTEREEVDPSDLMQQS